MAQFHSLSFPSALLQRGFWLYVWVVTTKNGREVLYVGRTGDSSSPHAQSPYRRMGQHLAPGDTSTNMLHRNLVKHNFDPNRCKSFEMVAYGPILPEGRNMKEHTPRRNIIAAMEKELRDSLCNAGYTVLNSVPCKQPLDHTHWKRVLAAFSERFPKLKRALA